VRHAILVLTAVLSMPVGAQGDLSLDNVFPGYEEAQISGSGEHSTARFRGDVDQQTAILQGLLYIPDETFTLVLGAGWLATRIDADKLRAGDEGPIVSLQGRLRFSDKLGLLLGVDRIELDSDAKINVYRANLLMNDGESALDIVFSYEFGDTVGSQGAVQTYGLDFRCAF